MDPIGALGLASNVVQFVDFTCGLMSKAVEIHRSASGSTADILDLDNLYGTLQSHLQELVAGCNDPNNLFGVPAATSTSQPLPLRRMLTLCEGDCRKLLAVIDKLKAPGKSGGRWRSFRAALAQVWAASDIKDLEDRLTRTQTSMTLVIVSLSSKAQEFRMDELKKLQDQCQTLHMDQATRITGFMSEMRDFKASLSLFQEKHERKAPPSEEIDRLEEELRTMSRSHASIRDEQGILKSLSFEAQPIRHENIPKAYQKTFEWVYQPQGDDQNTVGHFAQWLKSDEQFFWISGKPGSGKSTFMKFVAGQARTRGLLLEWAKMNRLVIASHYFWSAGTEMQKSEQGLLRTLLYDIFRQCPDLIVPICGNRRADTAEVSEHNYLPWTLPELYEALSKITAYDNNFRLCLFIDGLDEYMGEHAEMCRVLKDLVESSSIKMCVSSRPWNYFEDGFGQQQNKLYIQDLTRNDILEYIRDNLHGHDRWQYLEEAPSQGDKLIQEIEQRASGVFLWVYLVIKKLQHGLTNRDSLFNLERRLRSVPTELEDFFTQILESVEDFYHEQMATTLQIAVAANEPLHKSAYYFHDREYENEEYFFTLPIGPLDPRVVNDINNNTGHRLNGRARGLLEINRRSGTVTFLHRTVMDFLKTPKMSEYLIKRAPNNFNIPLCLLKIYASMIRVQSFEIVSRKEFGLYRECPLQSLTAKALESATIVCDSSTSAVKAHEILEELDRTLLVKSRDKQVTFDSNSPAAAFFREQLISGQHLRFMSWMLPRQRTYLSGFDPTLILRVLAPKDNHQETRLDKQWRCRGTEMLKLILETQELNPNQYQWNLDFKKAWTPWTALVRYATSWSREESKATEDHFWDLMEHDVFNLLLHKGADPNAIVWVDVTEGWTAFGAFLNLAFKVPADVRREASYIQTVKRFLRLHDFRDDSEIRHLHGTIQVTKGSKTKLRITGEVFLSRLQNECETDPERCNITLLAKLVDLLGFRHQISDLVRNILFMSEPVA